jgi:hypothetical protein
LYRYRLLAEQIAWIEFDHSPPMPALSRGLLKVEKSFRDRKNASVSHHSREVGKAGCEGWLRSNLSSKLLNISPPKAGTFLPFAAKGMTEHDQAPEQCSQRRRMRAFEPAPVFGTTTVPDLNL